jgi:hypothetical protein
MATAEPGESVDISAWVANTGGIEAPCTVSLRTEGTAEETQEITLVPGAGQMVIFSVTRDIVGSYDVETDALKAEFDI